MKNFPNILVSANLSALNIPASGLVLSDLVQEFFSMLHVLFFF